MSVVGFIKCLATMTLSLASKDVTALKTKYHNWENEAAPFLRKHGIYRDFTVISKDFIKSKMEFTEADGLDMSNVLKPKMPALVADTSIAHEQLSLIKDISLFFRKDSTPAWNRISKNISIVHEPELAAAFLDEDEDKGSTVGDMRAHNAMSKIVLKLTGRIQDPVLTLNEIRDFRETNPKLIEQYSEHRKVFVANYKKALLKFVRTSGKPYVDVKVARKYLDALGVNYIPKGFVGNIDEQGRLYTTEGLQIAGMLIGEVVMNPKYNPKTDNTYVCSLLANAAQSLRTVNFIAKNKAARFEKVHAFIEDVDKHRASWVKDLKSLDEKVQILATMVETIYQTQARIGGDSTNLEGEDRYGMSTLLVKHLKIAGDTINFDYPGKKGTRQHHQIRATTPANRQVISKIKALIKGKTAEDHVFTFRGKRIIGVDVNRYLKSKGVNVSIHKFRHLAGTKLAMEILKKAPFKKGAVTQAAAEKWVKEEMKAVGTLLHHRTGSGEKERVTAMTAIGAYISPDLMKQFFSGLGLRVPKWIPKTS